jgi:hypothetical protein
MSDVPDNFEITMGHDLPVIMWLCRYCGHEMGQCDDEGCLCGKCCFTERVDQTETPKSEGNVSSS